MRDIQTSLSCSDSQRWEIHMRCEWWQVRWRHDPVAPHEFGHIFCYTFKQPEVFTKRELMQWKSLQAYSYFQNGHVRFVKVYKAQSSFILMALNFVNLSQNSPDSVHHTCIALYSDGEVITVHCSATVWLGELHISSSRSKSTSWMHNFIFFLDLVSVFHTLQQLCSKIESAVRNG